MKYKDKNKILHLIIGISLLVISICLYIGFRPIFIFANLALIIFLVDYSILPFSYLYQILIQWLPLLFELNIFNGILLFTQIFHFSIFWSMIFSSICIVRCMITIYGHYLTTNDYHRLYIEDKIQILSNLLIRESKNLYNRLFTYNDNSVIDEFQLEQINSVESLVNEHDETLQRFQLMTDEFSSPTLSNIDCSNRWTRSTRRHRQHAVQQDEFETLSHRSTHSNLTQENISHSTANRSYTGVLTRNRARTSGSNSMTISPLKNQNIN